MKKFSKALLAIMFVLSMFAFSLVSCAKTETKTYSVTVNPCTGVTVDCATKIKEGSTLKFTVALNEDYVGDLSVTATVGGNEAAVESGNAGEYSIAKVKGDVVITVAGARKQTYAVTVNKCDGAIVSCAESVEKNDLLTFSVAVAEGYEGTPSIAVTMGGTEVDAPYTGNFYTVNNVTGEIVITITGITKKSFAVTKTAGEGITAINGEDTVLYGEDYTFTVTKADGYDKVSVTATVGGETVDVAEANGTYTVAAVKGALVINATTNGKVKYNIEFTCEDQHVTIPENTSVEYDGTYTFDVTPEEGYEFDGDVVVMANDVAVAKNSEGKYELKNVTEYQDVVITATVKEIKFSITYTADVAAGLAAQELNEYSYLAKDVKFRITLAGDYSKSPITVTYAYGDHDAVTLTADADGYYTFANVKANVTVNVTGLVLDTYEVKFMLGDEEKYSTTVKVHEKLTAEQLELAAEKVVENTEYKFNGWDKSTDTEITADCEFVAKTLWGEKIDEPFTRQLKDERFSMSEDTDTSAPDNFEKVYKYVWKKYMDEGAEKYGTASGNSVSAMNIGKYNKIGFKMKSNHWVLFSGWDFARAYTEDWAEIKIVKNSRANYTLTVVYGTDTYTDTLKGETLANIFAKFSGSPLTGVTDEYTLWITELRVIEDTEYVPAAATGELIGNPLREDKNLGVVSDVVAPMGYTTVYKAQDPDMAAINISKYTEVRMGIMMNGYFLFESWNKLADARGVWLEIKLTRQDNGSWKAVVINLYQGNEHYSTTSESNVLNEIVAWGFGLASDEQAQMMYITELRGQLESGWSVIDQAIITGGQKVTETPVVGFDSVYAYTLTKVSEDYPKIPFADIDISGYDKVTFAIKYSTYVFITGDWGAYTVSQRWIPVTLTKIDGGWQVTVSSVDGGNKKDYFDAVHTGETLSAVLSDWAIGNSYVSDTANNIMYVTEIQAHTAITAE